jgi:hypothetical protein
VNGRVTDGICTCGYGLEQERTKADLSARFSKEKLDSILMAPKTETITWKPASEPPDSQRTILMDTVHGVVTGFRDGDKWRWIGGFQTYVLPSYWAELPEGPQ